jgi:hypothetical protein
MAVAMTMAVAAAVAMIVSRRRLGPADETLVVDMHVQPAELKRQQAKTGGNSDWPGQAAHQLSIQPCFVTPRLQSDEYVV